MAGMSQDEVELAADGAPDKAELAADVALDEAGGADPAGGTDNADGAGWAARPALVADVAESGAPTGAVDQRAVRVTLGPAHADVALPALVVAPGPASSDPGVVLVDGQPTVARLTQQGHSRAVLVVADQVAVGNAEPDDPTAPTQTGPIATTRLLIETPEVRAPGSGVRRFDVVVDGWRIELEVETERRAALRERARRGRTGAAHGGPTDVRAIIPGRIVSVSVGAGETVVAGQQVLVVEAMKMQNELRAPRDGVVTRVAVAAGQTIEIGDLLLVVE
jgi:biotin carboxyl carrier protein